MSCLVRRKMNSYDDECPKCQTPNSNLTRITNPESTAPDYLLVVVMRYINNLIFRTPQRINVSKVFR
jgi:hypothetical protein